MYQNKKEERSNGKRMKRVTLCDLAVQPSLMAVQPELK